MKFFRNLRTLLYVAIIAAIVVIANWHDTFPITLAIGEWQSEPSLLAAIAGAVLFYCVLTILLKILHIILSAPMLIQTWMQKRATINHHQLLENGVRAAALGDYKHALKVFQRLAKESKNNKNRKYGFRDEIYAWLAADAAERIGASKKQNEILQSISQMQYGTPNKKGDTDHTIIAAAKAKLAYDDSQPQEALRILTAAGAPDASPLLAKMYRIIASECQEWTKALSAAYRLHALSPTRKNEKIVRALIEQGLSHIEKPEVLTDFWKNCVRSNEQKQADLIAQYAHALHRVGDNTTAQKTLEQAIKPHRDNAAILEAVAALGTHKLCETAYAAVRNPETPALLPAMAQLAMRIELWGQARRYYQMANALQHKPAYVAALETIKERIHQSEVINASKTTDANNAK